MHNIKRNFDQSATSFSCLCKGFYDPLKAFYLKNKNISQKFEKPPIIEDSRQMLNTKSQKTSDNINETQTFQEKSNSLSIKRRETALKDLNLKKKAKIDPSNLRKNPENEIEIEETNKEQINEENYSSKIADNDSISSVELKKSENKGKKNKTHKNLTTKSEEFKLSEKEDEYPFLESKNEKVSSLKNNEEVEAATEENSKPQKLFSFFKFAE